MSVAGYVRCPNCGNSIIDEGGDEIVCPNCSTHFGRHSTPSAGLRLNGPGLALIFTAAIGFFGNCASGVVAIAIPRQPIPDQRPANMDEATWRSYRNGREAAPGLGACLATAPMIFIYPLVLLGGIQMRAKRNYAICIVAALFAMLPCGLAFLVGLPSGLWALHTLTQREVRAEF